MNSRSSAPVLMLLGFIVVGLVACASLEPITGFKQYAPSKQMLGKTPEQFIALLGKPAAALDTPTGRR